MARDPRRLARPLFPINLLLRYLRGTFLVDQDDLNVLDLWF